jgi:Immunoglobulin domain
MSQCCISLLHYSEFQVGRIRILATPKDTITQLDSRVVIECSVTSMSATDSVTWWYSDGKTYQRLFTSSVVEPESSVVADTESYEISDQYNLVIKSAKFRDAGTYICEISGHRNYTAELSVLGILLFCASLKFRLGQCHLIYG